MEGSFVLDADMNRFYDNNNPVKMAHNGWEKRNLETSCTDGEKKLLDVNKVTFVVSRGKQEDKQPWK